MAYAPKKPETSNNKRGRIPGGVGKRGGRIPGGVAILWNKKYDQLVNVVRLEVDWAIGI